MVAPLHFINTPVKYRCGLGDISVMTGVNDEECRYSWQVLAVCDE